MSRREQLNKVLDLMEEIEDLPSKARLATIAKSLLTKHIYDRQAHQARKALRVEEIRELENRNKLPAVRLYRDRMQCTLLEAKKDVEQYMLNRWGSTYFNEIHVIDKTH